MRAGRLAAGAWSASPIIRAAEADGQADQRLRTGAIVGAEGAAADRLLRGGRAARGIGVEPLRAAKAVAPGAPVRTRGSQAVAASLLQAAIAPAPRRAASAGRDLLMSAVNWPPAAKVGRLSDAGVARRTAPSAPTACWPCDRPNRAGMAPRPGPALKAVSSARATEIWLPPRPGVEAIDDCRFSDDVGQAVAQAGAQEARQVLRRQRAERAG